MKVKRKIVAMLIALICTLSLLVGCNEQETQTVYKLYFGLNDAITGVQVVDTEKAKQKIGKIITDLGYGYTEYETFGGYPEDGGVCLNVTLVYELFYVEEQDMELIAQTAKTELNIASVLITVTDAYEYYLI